MGPYVVFNSLFFCELNKSLPIAAICLALPRSSFLSKRIARLPMRSPLATLCGATGLSATSLASLDG